MTRSKPIVNLPLQRALKLADAGFHVFPLVRNTKFPAIKKWQDVATMDRNQITHWFDGRDFNIGICTSRFGDTGHLVVLDVDTKNGKKGMQSLELLQLTEELPATMVTTTPNNGYHYFFRCDKPFKSGVNILGDGIDIRATGGFVVAPGSSLPNRSYTSDMSPVTPLPSRIEHLLDDYKPKQDIIELADFVLDRAVNTDKAEHYLKENAEHAIEGSGGDATTFAVACMVIDFGLSPQMTFNLMRDHWNTACIPPWPENDLKLKIHNAARYRENTIGSRTGEHEFGGTLALSEEQVATLEAQSAPCNAETSLSPETPMDLLTINHMLNRPPPVQIIKNILPQKGVAIVAGESRHMKSFLVLSLMLSLATKTDVFGETVDQTKVVYTMNEGQAAFAWRASGWLDHNGFPVDTEIDDWFRLMETTPNLMIPESVKSFIGIIDKSDFNPAVVVIDTFSKATVGGDDNSTKEMSIAIANAYAIANAIDGLVILIDHFGKDTKKGLRGASAKFAAADMVGLVVKDEKDKVTLRTDKMKDGEDDLLFNFDIIECKREDRMPVVMPARGLNTLPSQPDWILGYLALNGEIDGEEAREAMIGTFITEYGCDRRTWHTVSGRLEHRGLIVIKDNGNKIKMVNIY